MRALMDDFVKAIKAELPNSIISWDISAWIGKEGFTKWLLITEFKLFIFAENIFKRMFLNFLGGVTSKQRIILILFILVVDK